MLDEYQSVDGLIDEIKGTAGFLSNLFTRKFGFVFLFIALGVLITSYLF